MKILNQILQPVKKFSKGMFALLTLNLLVVLCIFIFDSCKKATHENNDSKKANEKFTAALEKNKKSIAAISFSKNTKARSVAPPTEELSEYQSVYISIPSDIDAQTSNIAYTTNSIQHLSDLIQTTDLDIQYEPITGNTNHQVNVPIDAVTNSLQPLVLESKQYLYAKGFTEQDIQQMLIEEQGIETDLIPFVMELTKLESEQAIASANYLNYFVNSAHARKLTGNDFIRCGIVAIGADFIYGLSGSMASSWTVSAMKKAFGAVAKRMLGPIGVAISVVSFGICIGEAYYS